MALHARNAPARDDRRGAEHHRVRPQAQRLDRVDSVADPAHQHDLDVLATPDLLQGVNRLDDGGNGGPGQRGTRGCHRPPSRRVMANTRMHGVGLHMSGRADLTGGALGCGGGYRTRRAGDPADWVLECSVQLAPGRSDRGPPGGSAQHRRG